MVKDSGIGKLAVMLAMSSGEEEKTFGKKTTDMGYSFCKGRVGTVEPGKIIAAVETAAKRNELVKNQYREEHALYHCVIDALHGICRGELALGSILRTAGLSFSIMRGPRQPGETADGEWISVALYGTIGAPVKGFEHEAIGLGVIHI